METLLRKNDVSGTIQVLKGDKSPIAAIIKKGSKKHKYGYARVREAIEDSGNQEIAKSERGLWGSCNSCRFSSIIGISWHGYRFGSSIYDS